MLAAMKIRHYWDGASDFFPILFSPGLPANSYLLQNENRTRFQDTYERLAVSQADAEGCQFLSTALLSFGFIDTAAQRNISV